MFKELLFEDGYYTCGTFTKENIRELKNLHGIIVHEEATRKDMTEEEKELEAVMNHYDDGCKKWSELLARI